MTADTATPLTWIEVTNPATSEPVGRVAAVAPHELPALSARARAAQPAWEDAGFEFRERVFKRAQKWLLDQSGRFNDTIRAETGKTYEDAQLEIVAATRSFGFWASHARKYLADERVRATSPLTLRPAADGPLPTHGPHRGDRTLELPAGQRIL